MTFARAQRHLAAAALAAFACVGLSGCGESCDDPWIIQTGTYRSVLLYQFEGPKPQQAFPHKRGKSIEMTIYSDLEEIRFQYKRDGQPVEEIWTCVGRELLPADAVTDTDAAP